MNKEDLKIVFLGTPEFAVESLEAIVDNGYNVVGVVTMPDKPAGRGHKLLHSPVKEFALARGLEPILQPTNLKDSEFVEQLRSLGANLFVVIAFRMLPEVVWQMPELGTFNLHASLLPDYRGAAPINRAVMNGETTTGVTTFFLKHEIDTGDIIDREAVDILPSENVGDVHDKLMHLGAKLTLKTLDRIVNGTLAPIPQADLLTQDHEPKPAPKIFKETCHIDWNQPVDIIHNLVRGLSPYPAAWATITDNGPLNNLQLKIFESKIEQLSADEQPFCPGKVMISDGKMTVDCANGRLQLLEVQVQGKKRMNVADFLRGAKLNDPVLS